MIAKLINKYILPNLTKFIKVCKYTVVVKFKYIGKKSFNNLHNGIY